jgi:hypothetical protein
LIEQEDEDISQQINDITEFNDISEFLQDSDVDEAMEIIIRLIAKPNVPHKVAAPLIVKLQALSAKFSLMAKYHMLYTPTVKEDRTKSKKKNTYLDLSDSLEKLANALKYLARD